ncbi:MAG: sugar ABC transporter ATP-binding protein [Treponema sp.]|jgi:ABC-type sugar transport system ATPase subunit|nr:sugar ABC transporter ATP-binding protein [Treponema sp.]
MGQALVEIRNITKKFPGVAALQDVSFTINTGEIHALIGENGAGKSTLIKILSGLYKPETGGEIVFAGEPLREYSALESLHRGIVVIYQDFSLFSNLSVLENIALGPYVKDGKRLVDWKAMREIAEAAMKKLQIQIDLDVPVGSLSVAKQQLVAIARALANQARLLVLDEPTSALSKGEVVKLFEIMRSLKDEGLALLFVSHKLDELFAVSDRFTVFRDGRCMGTFEGSELDDDRLISLMVGRKIVYRIFEKNKRDDVIMEVRNLSKAGQFRDISFKLNRGEILGITGLVGAGRTEVAQAIFGLNSFDSGEILLEGKPLRIQKPGGAVEKGIAYVPENRLQEGLVLGKSVKDNLVITVLGAISNRVGLVDNTKKSKLTAEWMEKLNIKPALPDLPTSKLSGGNQQRVVLSKWLATNPKILMVDEPTNGVDVGAKTEIHQILRSLAESGIAVIVISSELPEILAITDRVIIMRRGRISAEWFCEDLNQEDILSKAI